MPARPTPITRDPFRAADASLPYPQASLDAHHEGDLRAYHSLFRCLCELLTSTPPQASLNAHHATVGDTRHAERRELQQVG